MGSQRAYQGDWEFNRSAEGWAAAAQLGNGATAGDDSCCMHWGMSNLVELRGSEAVPAPLVGLQLLSAMQAEPVAARSTGSRPEAATAGAACLLRCCAHTAGMVRAEAGRETCVWVKAREIETRRLG